MAGGRVSPSLVDRVRAAESTIARFNGQPFLWGENDCVRLAAHVLRQLGRAPPLRQAGHYSTFLGAHRALKRTGHARLEDWVDAWGLKRIVPASILPGDIVALPPKEEGDWPALGVTLSSGHFLAFLSGEGAVITCQPGFGPAIAWSAVP